jgi:putative DNA primase/helicase
MANRDDAIAQMRAAGMPDFPPGHPRIPSGKIIRYGPKKKFWYQLHEWRARNGQYYVAGAYGAWDGSVPTSKIETNFEGMDPQERERLDQAAAARAAEEAEKRAARARYAANRARSQWQAARASKPEGIDTYLDRKGVNGQKGLRFLPDGTLLVPVVRYDVTEEMEADPEYTGPRRLVGLQNIAPDGTKRFNKGLAKGGGACLLGKFPKKGEPILITEGVATGLSIREATERQYPVFVAFDAGNLLPAAKILRALYPHNPFVFCADDDAYLVSSLNKMLQENWGLDALVEPTIVDRAFSSRFGPVLISASYAKDGDGVVGIVGAVKHEERTITFMRQNAGLIYAYRAHAEVCNAEVLAPSFNSRPLPPDLDPIKLTDFNDLHASEGIEVVRAQFEAALKRFKLSAAIREVVREEATKAKPKRKAPPADNVFRKFLQRFTLIYPTKTVYDAEIGAICEISAVKIAFGEGLVKWWLESDERRTVNQEQVVFDPRGEHDPASVVNLFRGIEFQPAQQGTGSCQRLLELLQFLCGEGDHDGETPVTDWVLNWLAYPLQHVGTKMATAVVLHGPSEGTGKNLFFNVLRTIYGRYAGLITQTELEAPYNDWMSQKLFMIANEVISRQEMRHHVGRLKNLVTESPLPIQAKYLPMRYEDNHMNMVFLTNELQALQISPGDRRYMVIRTPAVNKPEFYQAVVDEIAAGGAASLYRYLLDRELGEFDPHTKPMMTAAKEALIDMGLTSPQQFWQELHDGLLYPVPYGPCFFSDLYGLYTAWCTVNGIKSPYQSNRFSHEFQSCNGVWRGLQRVADPDKPEETTKTASQLPQRTVLVMGDRSESVDPKEFVKAGVKEFREGMRSWLRDYSSRRRLRSGDEDGARDGQPS